MVTKTITAIKKWRDVEKNKPTNGGDVWVSFPTKDGRKVTVGIRNDNKFYNSFSGFEIVGVDYWKSYYTPKPPKL